MANDVCYNTLRMCDGMCAGGCVCVCAPLALALARATATNTWPELSLARAQPSLGQEKCPHTPRCRAIVVNVLGTLATFTRRSNFKQQTTTFLMICHPFCSAVPPLGDSARLPSLTPLATAKSVIIIFIVNISATHDKLI